jgi:hypothetical protein
MQPDVQTLLLFLLASLIALSLALPVVMGWRVSTGARCTQGAVAAQALGWLCFVMAARWNDRLLSTACMALLGASFVLMWFALRHWLGPRPGGRVLPALALLTPAGYWITFSSYSVRVGWSNFGLAAQIAVVCAALAWPAPHASRR